MTQPLRPAATRPDPTPDTALDARLAREPSLEGRLRLIFANLDRPIAFSTSLGLEDQAILHALSQIDADASAVDVFMLDTGRHFPETLDTLEASERRYGRRIRVIAPAADGLSELVARDGINGFRHTVGNRKSCCDVRKVRPLRLALANANGWITGLRRGQSNGRMQVPFATYDPGFRLPKFNPLADWSSDRLQTYITSNAVPVSALHAQGFPSIGCQPCTRAIAPGEDIRAGRWWWENQQDLMDGKECGLHSRAATLEPPGATQ